LNIDFLLNNASRPIYENADNSHFSLFNGLQSQGSQSEEDIHSKFDDKIYFSSGNAPPEETYENGVYFGNGHAATKTIKTKLISVLIILHPKKPISRLYQKELKKISIEAKVIKMKRERCP